MMRSECEEDLSGQVQFHGFSQFLRFKPGTVAWSGAVPDIRVDCWDISCQSDFDKNKIHVFVSLKTYFLV